MKVFPVTLLFAVLASCHGYSFIIPASLKHPGVCYFNGHVLLKGDNQMPTSCQNMKCNEDGSILVEGCGRLDIHNCTMLEPTNLDRPYPDCCEMSYRCTDADGNMFTKQWNQIKEGKTQPQPQPQPEPQTEPQPEPLEPSGTWEEKISEEQSDELYENDY